MTVIQVRAAAGGVGASTIAWCLARARAGSYALDASNSQGGLAAAAGESLNLDFAWPLIAAEATPASVLNCAVTAGSNRILSGGLPPPADLLAQTIAQCMADVVVDGYAGDFFTLGVSTNDFPIWQRSRETSVSCWFVQLRSGGLTKAEIQADCQVPVYAMKHQSTFTRAWQIGLGTPTSAQCVRVMKSIWQAADAR